MNNDLRQNAEKYNRRYRLRRLWHRIVSILGCIVVFCTTYALILPAITQERTAFCGKEPHIHNENCYTQIIEITQEESMETASDSNAVKVLICTIPELRQHTHNNECYAVQEEHVHDETCFYVERGELICELEEKEIHIHDDSCYSEPELICTCTATDSNAHSEACYSEPALICEVPEGHIHEESCYEQIQTVVCKATAGNSEPVLVCEEPEVKVHTHTEDCYEIAEQEPEYSEKEEIPLTCELEENETHTHSKLCYGTWELTCEMEEHTHRLICYSDKSADLENENVWMRTFEDIELTGNWAEDVLAIAKTQLGYHESTKNYVVAEDGEETKGYTRYGEWYGEPYGDWCAMFVSFCLHYAEVDGIGLDSNCQNWLETLSEESVGMYHEAGTYDCKPGDLIFFDTDGDSVSDHIGIVAEASSSEYATESNATDSNARTIKTIEGNSANKVRYVTYAPDDERILGFGELPENMVVDPTKTHVHCETCYDGDGNVICGFEAETNLSEEDYNRVALAIGMIEEMPSADEIDAAIWEFEEREDYEGEEKWLTETYQLIARVYKRYSELPENLREYVWNREKLLELEYIWSMVPLADIEIADTVEYSADIFEMYSSFVVYTNSGNRYYAFGGNGQAVPISIEPDGTIMANVSNKNELLWTFSKRSQGDNFYLIRNLSTGRYMHAYPNNGTGVTTSGDYPSELIITSSGVRIKSNTEYAKLNTTNSAFQMTQDANSAALYSFGACQDAYLWLDGTNGGLMSLSGSPNEGEMVSIGDTYILPEAWDSPTKYNYKLRGWYDVVNSKYYLPGSEVAIKGSTVFYADWEAQTYDVGQFNAYVADTVSTNSFITTRVFDYSTMFNMHSESVAVNANAAGHSETWTLVADGTVPYNQEETLNFIFSDYDGDGDISYPAGRNSANTNGGIYSGLYDETLADTLFGIDNLYDPVTRKGVLGKQYIGQGDHLFQYGTEQGSENFGYYYYDSMLNAASYNKSAGRFYVYDYLERTRDSDKDKGDGEFSDFLPFNSPYANTNGKTVSTYLYAGKGGEYSGTTHYMYDAKYNTNNNSPENVGTNYWFGMSSDIEFYLPNTPGTKDSEGNYGNKSIYGADLIFEFSGDDDVWVLVDGKLVLDLGGIHGIEGGHINFSTGEVFVNNTATSSLTGIGPGAHTLTFYYLERGSSQSNCKIRFNISPRYTLTLQKEDVLTQEALNGAEFTVYTDPACTQPAELWSSKESHQNDDEPKNVFTVQDGKAVMWGFAAGNTYYIKETKSPYGESVITNGIIVMTLNNLGTSSYDVIEDPNGTGESGNLTGGFTVHGFKVDYEKQEAYLVATNGEDIGETTSVQIEKRWNDTADHSATPVTVYLHADGVRIREVTLDINNGWKYIWENLPKYREDGTTEIAYTVQEGTVPGYIGKIEQVTEDTITTTTWTKASGFANGGTYLLWTSSGYLKAENNYLSWETNEDTAKNSAACRWNAVVSGNSVKLTNELGQTLYYTSQGFKAASNPSSGSSLTFLNNNFSYTSYYTQYYLGTISNGTASSTWSSNSALTFSLLRETTETTSTPIQGIAYKITNTPVSEEEIVSLTVTKSWSLGNLGTTSMYEELTVGIRLLENGVDTGLTEKLNLKNNWTATFTGLPKHDESEKEITYTVAEVPIDGPWRTEYGEVELVKGTDNQYTTTITNVCTLIYELPETGGIGTTIFYVIGGVLVFAAVVLMITKRRMNK